MSKKSSRPKGPSDPTDRPGGAGVTVVEGPTLRLGEGGGASLATSDPDGTLVSRVETPDRAAGLHRSSERPTDEDAPTAMIDLNAIAGAPSPPAPPTRQPEIKTHLPPPPARPVAPAKGADPNAATMRPAQPTLDDKTTAMPPAQGSAQDQSKGPLGLDIVMRWSGELHTARFFARPSNVFIGRDGDFALPDDAMGGKHLDLLVEPDTKDGFALRLDNPAIAGQIIANGGVTSISELKAGKRTRVPMTATTQAFLEFGDFTFVLSRGSVPPMAPPSLWSSENTVFLVCWLLAMATILGPVVASFQLTDPRARRTKTYVEELEERTAQIIEVEKIEEKKEEEKVEEKKEDKAEAPKNEVQIQAPEIKKQQDEIKKVLDEVPKEQRDEKIKEMVDKEAAKATAEVDKALADVENKTKLFAFDEAAPGVNPGAGGPQLVADLGDSPSGGPGGPRGPAVGSGDDTRAQTAGLDKKMDTGGKGPDVGANIKEGKQKIEAIVRGGGPSADGELSPDIIKKVMADKSGAIKACYQKELQKNPDLSGDIKVAFMIGPDGKVVGVKIEGSSLENTQVENCIVDNIKTWRFPQAKGGGSTKVSKKFTFKSS